MMSSLFVAPGSGSVAAGVSVGLLGTVADASLANALADGADDIEAADSPGLGAASAAGSATTMTASAPLASVPTTTAWASTGDWNTNFGTAARVTRRACPSENGAQSGWRFGGQTAAMLATL